MASLVKRFTCREVDQRSVQSGVNMTKPSENWRAILLCAFFVFGVSGSQGAGPSPRALEDFESGMVPQGWTASDGGTLAVTDERFKHGGKSLRWTWDKPGASLTWICPEAFKGSKIVENFNFWFYNETAVQKVLRVEFLDDKNQGSRNVGGRSTFGDGGPWGLPITRCLATSNRCIASWEFVLLRPRG